MVTNVVKIGGELLLPGKKEELNFVLGAVKQRLASSEAVLLVHGGGPQTNTLSKLYGREPQMVEGRRVTDEVTLWTMVQAVAGEVNVRLTSALQVVGIPSLGINGVSGFCVECSKEMPKEINGRVIDYGFVGEIRAVKAEFLNSLLAQNIVPVMACIGSDPSGQVFNVNADTMARALAVALRAERLVFLTGAPGVLRDPSDPSSRWDRLSSATAEAAIQAGQIRGGMIPKIREALQAASQGVGEVHILGCLNEGDFESAVRAPGSLGTLLTA